MKYKDYSLVNINIIAFIICMFIITSFSLLCKINIYSNYKLIYINNNVYEVIVNSKELNNFYNNSSLYLKNKKYNYKIDRVNKNILVKNNKKYHELYIKFKYDKYKSNDIVDIALIDKRKRVINIFIDVYRN
ncbi:MAG: hypothetical protein IJI43_00880 [Bacilli bacterium]|nr:hypothetical protein [Bacilli bacterium]